MLSGVGYNRTLKFQIRARPTSMGCCVTLKRKPGQVFYLTKTYDANLKILRKIEAAETEAELANVLAASGLVMYTHENGDGV